MTSLKQNICVCYEPQRQKTYMGMCAQRRFRSVCAFAQSDQNLHCAHFRYPRIDCFSMRITMTDQTARKGSLISVCFGRTCQKVRFLTLRLLKLCVLFTDANRSDTPQWYRASSRESGKRNVVFCIWASYCELICILFPNSTPSYKML